MAVRHGLIGFVTSATRTINVVPKRGKVPVLGTNPIAFAAPTRRNRPFLLDLATATTASNKVKVYELNGKTLPPGWVVDEEGQPVRDAATAMDYFRRYVGGLTPLGGTAEMTSYKGYGLGMMAHILGGALSGASFSPIRTRTQRPGDPDNLGHFFLALDPKAFREEGAFEADLDDAIDVLHETPQADPALPVLVAGDPQSESRERRLREGIPSPRRCSRRSARSVTLAARNDAREGRLTDPCTPQVRTIRRISRLCAARVSDAEWQARVDLAACYRLVDFYGMTDLIYNHITVRIPGTEHLLVNLYGLLYKEITASNLAKIDVEGNIIWKPETDYGINHAGYVIHGAIHKARPDVNAIIHTHTRAGMAVSAMKCGLLPLNQTSIRFHNHIGYHDYEGPAINLEEREQLVPTFAGR